MDEQNAEVGKRITNIRKRRGYTREHLSELADVSVQFLADIEKGRKTMTVTTLRKVASTLNVSTDYIVNGTLSHEENAELNAMLSSMPKGVRKQAERLLSVYLEAVAAAGRSDV